MFRNLSAVSNRSREKDVLQSEALNTIFLVNYFYQSHFSVGHCRLKSWLVQYMCVCLCVSGPFIYRHFHLEWNKFVLKRFIQ